MSGHSNESSATFVAEDAKKKNMKSYNPSSLALYIHKNHLDPMDVLWMSI